MVWHLLKHRENFTFSLPLKLYAPRSSKMEIYSLLQQVCIKSAWIYSN